MSFSNSPIFFYPKSNKKLKDVFGLDDVKEVLYKKIIVPIKNKTSFEDFESKPPVVILLHGPSGCGKLTLMNAIANEVDAKISSLSNKEIELIRNGDSRTILKEFFSKAGTRGTSSIILLDKFDSLYSFPPGVLYEKLFKKEISDEKTFLTSYRNNITDCLLEEMNKLSQITDVYVILSTSDKIHNFLPILRPGIISTALYIGFPDQKTKVKIIQQYTTLKIMGKKFELLDSISANSIARKLENYSVRNCHEIINEVRDNTLHINRYLEISDPMEILEFERRFVYTLMAYFR